MLDLVNLRNRHFKEACRRVMAQSDRPLTTAEIAARAASQPAPCYYCTYEYALRCIRVLRHGRLHVKEGRRARMWREIDGKTRLVQERHGISLPAALMRVLAECTASEFFISPQRAYILACQAD